MDRRNGWIKLTSAILLGIIFFLFSPISAFAMEETEIEPTTKIGDTEEFPFDSSLINEQETASVTECQDEQYQTVTVTMNDPEQLTITMKGISDDNRDRILTQIEQGVDIMIMYNGSMKIEVQNLPDAEKYHLSDYDKDTCWAATAANMLWISGYGQQAVNPQTGTYFQSEDEVYDYFRHIFVDETGNPGVALEVFFTGDTDSGASGWLRPDAKPKPMISGWEDDPPFAFVAYTEGDSYISEFEKLTDVSFGAILHSIDRETCIYAGMAHSVTVAGIVYDRQEQNPADRYKAILMADSDNDRVLSNADTTDPAQRDIPDAQKAQMAAGAKNSYTLYTLSLKYYGEHIGYRWAIPYYVNPFSKIDVIIDAYAYLNDKVCPEQEDCVQQENQAKDNATYICQQSKNQAEKLCLKAEAFVYGKAYKDYDFSAVLKEMNEKNAQIYSYKEWIYNKKEKNPFHIFVRGSYHQLKNILLDGKPLLFCYLDVTMLDRDKEIFVIEFSEDVMQRISDGDHTLTIRLEGKEDITKMIHIQ